MRYNLETSLKNAVKRGCAGTNARPTQVFTEGLRLAMLYALDLCCKNLPSRLDGGNFNKFSEYVKKLSGEEPCLGELAAWKFLIKRPIFIERLYAVYTSYRRAEFVDAASSEDLSEVARATQKYRCGSVRSIGNFCAAMARELDLVKPGSTMLLSAMGSSGFRLWQLACENNARILAGDPTPVYQEAPKVLAAMWGCRPEFVSLSFTRDNQVDAIQPPELIVMSLADESKITKVTSGERANSAINPAMNPLEQLRRALNLLKDGGTLMAELPSSLLNSSKSIEVKLRQKLLELPMQYSIFTLPEDLRPQLPGGEAILVAKKGQRGDKIAFYDATACFEKAKPIPLKYDAVKGAEIIAKLKANTPDEDNEVANLLDEDGYRIVPSHRRSSEKVQDGYTRVRGLELFADIRRGLEFRPGMQDYCTKVPETELEHHLAREIYCLQPGNFSPLGVYDLCPMMMYRLPSYVRQEKRYEVKSGDLLLSHSSGVVRAGIMLDEDMNGRNFFASSNLLILTVNQELADPVYMLTVLLSEKGQETLRRCSSRGITKILRVPALQEIEFLLPSMEEQKQKAAAYMEVLKKVSKIKAAEVEANKELKACMQSIA
ncbi:MAG: hypothetical protein IJ228_10520 [Succinivibrio sp.]|nr:hypothetical protein [Succinivibrio sp.]